MSTGQIWQTESTSLDDTLAIAAGIGGRLRGGEVIVLVGDLGSGKTAFVRGLAKGMGSKDKVHSPSFTISNQYKAPKLTLHHFDFYRLDEPGIVRAELAEVLQDDQAAVAIEWAGVVEDVLPVEHATITFNPADETSRELRVEYPKAYEYLFPAKSNKT